MQTVSPKNWLALLAVIVVATSLVMWTLSGDSQVVDSDRQKSDKTVEKVATAKGLLASNRNAEALWFCKRALANAPNDAAILLMAGEAATKLEKFPEAIQLYSQVPESSRMSAAVAKWALGEIYLHLGQPTSSIEAFLISVKLNPEQYDAHERLIWLLSACGRRSEILPHAMTLLRAERATPVLLVDLGNLWTDAYPWGELEKFRQAAPEDVAPLLPFAMRAFQNGELQQAETLLDQYLKQQPSITAAHVLRGRIWMINSPNRFADWNKALPKNADASADMWLVKGTWFEQSGNTDAALRCMAEAVRREPNHAGAHANLARLLSNTNSNDTALISSITRRTSLLQQHQQTIDRIRWNKNYEATIQQAAELSFELGRIWEAVGWSGYGLNLNPSADWPRTLITSAQKLEGVNSHMPLTLDLGRVLRDTEWLNDYPQLAANLPDQPSESANISQAPTNIQPDIPTWNHIKFEDIAARADARFTYKSSMENRDSGRRMFEFTGGGVGVIDFDADGLEEFFLPQGTSWPIPTRPTSDGDRLFRNLGNNAQNVPSFLECSLPAGIVETGYGQGITVADVNGDGFEDIYVANVNRNQLWINRGDGTFANGEKLFPFNLQSYWTASTLALDVNGDGAPELFDINYATGNELDSLRCDVEGKPRVCPPLVFQPAPIELWVSQTKNGFHRHTWEDGKTLTAHGLGGIAYMSTAEHSPKVFLAVDQQANKLLGFRDDPVSGHLKITESAIISGIAYDHNGQAQACMGIAAGDISGNGEVDIFVTNFFQETNTLYIQEDGFFTDQTIRSGLAAPSRPMLGFGTQMIDIDLDGQLDIVVLNGHIDDFSHIGINEKMVPQVFMNAGKQKLLHVEGASVGNFFNKPALGRALAIADINRDGLVDLLCTDLEQPFAVLLNRSDPKGDVVTIRLVGTTSVRDATLSIVSLQAGEWKAAQQLTAGGGYMASNTRILHFAIPKDRSEDPFIAKVLWPNGQAEYFPLIRGVEPNLLIEGRGKPEEDDATLEIAE